jgi:hypothetical protein
MPQHDGFVGPIKLQKKHGTIARLQSLYEDYCTDA